MERSQGSFGEMVAGLSAVLLFLFMFLPWYGVTNSATIPGIGSFSRSGEKVNGWEAFSYTDLLLFIVVVVVVGIVVARALGSLPPLPRSPGLIIASAGVAAVVLILFRLLFTPSVDLSGLGFEADLGRKFGIFLALIAAGGITFGGYTALTEESSRR